MALLVIVRQSQEKNFFFFPFFFFSLHGFLAQDISNWDPHHTRLFRSLKGGSVFTVLSPTSWGITAIEVFIQR